MPITTLLFDLDDTLLGNNMDTFVPPYLQAFAGHVAGAVNPNQFVSNIMAGTQAMIANVDPRQTLEKTFYQAFYRDLSAGPETLVPLIDSFYAQKFSDLRSTTHQVPGARETIEWATAAGFKVVIATNALFPQSAIRQRLEWAGLGPHEFQYSLVTTLEFMHFAKPHPEYFAEILARVDSRPEEALMIGNDWSQDIAPAHALGLHTYWIKVANARPTANHAHPVGSGSLVDFLNWAKTPGHLTDLEVLPQKAPAVRAQQAAALATMLELTKDVSLENWKRRPAPNEWSLTEIACHLRDTEMEINLPRLQIILNDSNPFISAIESDPWALQRDYQSQAGPSALATFGEARRTKLALLDGLTADDWKHPARHAIFGPTSLKELVSFTIEHDRLHLRQLRENLRDFAL